MIIFRLKKSDVVSRYLLQTNAKVEYKVTLQFKLLVKLNNPEGESSDLYIRYGKHFNLEHNQYDAVSYGNIAE